MSVIVLRKLFAVVVVVLLGRVCASAQPEVSLLVDVPVPPEQITRLDERCNYIVNNFWKRLNYKNAFSSMDRMQATVGQFISVVPYATADTAMMAVDELIGGVEKADAKNLVKLARMVEYWCLSDSAEYPSEELMLPFARAVADSKKLKGPDKEYYASMARRLANSRVGAVPADFEFTVPDGTQGRLSEVKDPTVLLFFYDPSDFDSRLARTRLGNDYVVKTLTSHNLLKVVAIYPGAPDSVWQEDVESMPAGWVIGAAPGIEEWFTLKGKTQMYFLDESRKITDKDFGIDAALLYFSQFTRRQAN